MIKVQFLGLSPVCVEGFSEGSKRTFKGSLHLKPNQVYDISHDEYAHIKKVRADLKFHEFKLGNKVILPKKKKVEASVSEVVEPETDEDLLPSGDEDESDY